MIKYIKNIVIVGGGTSGWIAAKSISQGVPFAKVTLIDKEISKPIGVGEATLLNFKLFLKNYCNYSVDEIDQCLSYCESVQKKGILYPDWGCDGNQIWHPFHFAGMIPNGVDVPLLIDAWSLQDKIGITEIMPNLSTDVYAEHINALKLVEYLKNDLITDDSQYRINFIQSEVKDIERDDNGISSLILENGNIITADLFIDCTGFKGILKDKKDRIDLTDRLYVDTAVVCPVNYIDIEKELHTYTVAQAVDCGWIWKTPLQSRIGTGLVFNKSITNITDAKDYFCQHWNNRIQPEDTRVIDWSPYYDINQWDKNVVSIGLSAGFIEPLESTSIELILRGLMGLIDIINSRWYNDKCINSFNNYMISLYESSIDFVNMHYSLSTKDTPFWNYVRDNYKSSDILEMYKSNLDSSEPSIQKAPTEHFIGGGNWTHWMVQLGYPLAKKTYLTGDKNIRDRIYEVDTDIMDILIHESNWIQRKDTCNCKVCEGKING
tara:strand:- start:457 stop:1932 length:1476 start_codon:yes stop_codon:yes gene_type:complete